MIKAVEEESNKYGVEGWKLVNFSKDILSGSLFMMFKGPKED